MPTALQLVFRRVVKVSRPSGLKRSRSEPAAQFTGFSPAAFGFLSDLAANNDRDWYATRKPIYEREIVAPFRLLLAELMSALSARHIDLSGDPARAIFRIHRDVRFSNDKSPYKTHAGAVLSPGGVKGSGSGVLYIHIAPRGCFAASGFYYPEREALGALREAIYTEPQRFLTIVDELATAGLELDAEHSLIRLPKGYEDAANTAIVPVLKLKSFVVQRPIDAEAGAELIAQLVSFAEATQPLLRFGRQALTVLDPMALTRMKA